MLTETFFLEPYFESGGGLGAWPLCWAGLGWAGRAGLGWAAASLFGLAGAGWTRLGWAGLGWVSNPDYSKMKCKLVYSKMERCVSTKKMSFRMVNSNKQFLFISFLRV